MNTYDNKTRVFGFNKQKRCFLLFFLFFIEQFILFFFFCARTVMLSPQTAANRAARFF